MARHPDPMASGDLARAARLIEGADHIALAAHVHPDGDALGSMLALKLLCDAHGKTTVCSWPDPFVAGPHYDFLPGITDAVAPAEFPEAPDLMITFDLGRYERLGNLEGPARRAARLLVLDHHEDNRRFGTLNIVDTRAAATAVVVRQLAQELGWELTHDVAVCLYAGLVTDTGRFRYPNTTAEVFHLAEELAGFDLPIATIEWQLFEKHRFDYLRLVGAVLDRAHLDADNHLVVAWCTQADLDRFGVAFDETEGLIDIIRQAAEAEVSCVIRESEGACQRVSMRSTTAFDVGAIATAFGGGGHWFMSGFTSDEELPDLREQIVAAVREARRTTSEG